MTADVLIEALNSFAGKRIVVFGDSCLDVTLDCEWDDAPAGRRLRVAHRTEAGGMAQAVLGMVRGLGAEAVFPPFDWRKFSGTYTRILSGDYRVCPTIVEPQNWPDHAAINEWGAAEVCKLLPADAVILCDHGKGALRLQPLKAIMDRCLKDIIPVLVDPAPGRKWDDYSGATIVKGTDSEAAGQDFGIFPFSVVTKRHHGLTLHSGWFNAQHFPTSTLEGDPCGCGDMVAAVLGCCLAAGVDPAVGCALANVAAGLKLGKRGAVPVPADEIRAALLADRITHPEPVL